MGIKFVGRSLDSVVQEMNWDYRTVNDWATELTSRYWENREFSSPAWQSSREELGRFIQEHRSQIQKAYPHGIPDEVQDRVREPLSRIDFRWIQLHSDLGWDLDANRLTGDFLKKYPGSSLAEEASQRFSSKQASSRTRAFLDTTILEAGAAPGLVPFIGAWGGIFLYFWKSGWKGTHFRFSNWRFPAIALAGALTSTLLYALRPGEGVWGSRLIQIGLTPGRTWRAAKHQRLFGDTGDLLYSGYGQALFKIFTASLIACSIPVIWKSFISVSKVRSLAAPAGTSPWGSGEFKVRVTPAPLKAIHDFTKFHLDGIGGTLRKMRTESQEFLRGLQSGSSWRQMGEWFWSPGSTTVTRQMLRTIRISGAAGAVINLFDLIAPEQIKGSIPYYQTLRMVGGIAMTVATVEFTCTTMGCLRWGSYLNAASEVGMDFAGQSRTTKPEEINYFRFVVPILRTAIYKNALDVGFNLARGRRWAFHRWASRDLTPAPFPEAVARDMLSRRVTGQLFLREQKQTLFSRLGAAFEAMILSNILMIPAYAAEGLVARVNWENYAAARVEQILLPSFFMQFVTEWRGNYTSLLSILINKFAIFWTLGQASWNLHPRYAGEANGMRNFVDRLAVTQENSDEEVRTFLVKKFGHIEGGFWGYDQLTGYGRAFFYSFTDDDQPLGGLLAKVGVPIGPYMNTLFTPDTKSYWTLFDALEDPDHYGLSNEEADRILESIDKYLERIPDHSPKPSQGWVRGWEEWTLIRSMAIMAEIASEQSRLKKLKENRAVQAISKNGDLLKYLDVTTGKPREERLAEALQYLSYEAVRGYEGRKTYPAITGTNGTSKRPI